jgi:hypothetical protein
MTHNSQSSLTLTVSFLLVWYSKAIYPKPSPVFKAFLNFSFSRISNFPFWTMKKAGSRGIFIIDDTFTLAITDLEGGEEHFFFDIFEFCVTQVIENEVVPETTQYKVGVGVVFLFELDFDILLDSALDLPEMLIFELVVVIDQVRG